MRTYSQYPTEYAELLMKFRVTEAAQLGPIDKQTAHTIRRDLYRYISAVRAAAEADPSDEYLRDLFDAARNVMIRLVVAEDEYLITLSLNPVVATMRPPNHFTPQST